MMGLFRSRPWHAFGPPPSPTRDDAERFRKLIESGADGVLVVCPRGLICFVNPAACAMLGRPEAELMDQPFGVPIVPGETTEIDVRRGDGRAIVAEMRTAETTWKGEPAYVALLRDVTARKQAEEALREQDRRKDEFLAMLAHELRNPLAAISNAVSIAERSASEADQRWSRQVIGHQCSHLSRLVDDLLDVSRITRGKIELRRTLLDVGASVLHAVEAVRPLIRERDHRLEVSASDGSLWVEADPTRFEQILVNLLTNAAKYTEPGGRIWLQVGREGGEVVLRVKDDGIGIDPAAIPHMFEMFAQGKRSLARSEGGLGIGLTLVKALVEMHGGSIMATSDGPGLGSEFAVRFPAARSPSAPANAGAVTTDAMKRAARVLVVDDFLVAAQGLAKILEIHGHEVVMAHDGPSAIELAREVRPDVVLLDIGLPVMDGYEVAERLRREATVRDCLIIAISGYGQESDRQKSREAGMDHHMTKPIDLDALIGLLSRHDFAGQSPMAR